MKTQYSLIMFKNQTTDCSMSYIHGKDYQLSISIYAT